MTATEKDTQYTDVNFRMWQGAIIALFPHQVETRDGLVQSYMHIGQHGSANYTGIVRSSRPATEAEYADLKSEMEGLGHNIRVTTKQNRRKYLQNLLINH